MNNFTPVGIDRNAPIKGIKIVTQIQIGDDSNEYITHLSSNDVCEDDVKAVIVGHCQTILNGLRLIVTEKNARP
jgi:hypothetical protein